MTKHHRPLLFYFYAAVAYVTFAVAPAFAQSTAFPYHRIEVTLSGAGCGHAPQEISVVISAGEGKEFTLTRIPGTSQWAVDPGVWLPDSLASARWTVNGAGGKRTQCSKGEGRLRTNILRFSFSRCYVAQDVTFETDPGRTPSRFVRDLGPCKEALEFNGSETAEGVGFDVEDLRLQFGRQARKKESRGLLVNPVVVNAKSNKLVLTRDKVAHLLSTQRAKGDGAPSNLASTAIDLDIENLKAIPLNSVKIGVR